MNDMAYNDAVITMLLPMNKRVGAEGATDAQAYTTVNKSCCRHSRQGALKGAGLT